MTTKVFIPFLLLMLSGCLWGFIPSAPDRTVVRHALSSVVLNIFLPALTFNVLYRAPINRELWAVPLVSVAVCIAPLVAAWLIYRLIFFVSRRPLSRPAEGALLLAASWCNATYLGLPVITSLFGEHLQRIPILFDILASTPLLLTVGVGIGITYGASGSRTGTRRLLIEGLKAIIKLPPLWGGVVGFVFNITSVFVPLVIVNACALAGSAVAPMMIFAVGLALSFVGIKRVLWLSPAVTLKLLFAPLVAFVVAGVLGLTGEVRAATIIEAAMPTMVLTMVIADKYLLDAELIAQSIAVSTMLSFVSIPAIFALVR
jgi:malate permease and related proteins